MPAIIIDKEKCRKDKLCIAECPMKIITLGDEGFPVTALDAVDSCIGCGHCIAICPHGALSLPAVKAHDCDSIHPEWNPGIDIVEHYFKARRSIRRFKNDPVEREKLSKLIEIAAYAPTGHNSRTVEYIVYTKKEKINELIQHVIDWMKDMLANSPDVAKNMHFDMITKAWEAGIDVVTHDAPVLIFAHGNKSNPNTSTSCIIALSHVELIAPSLGLGCCWAGYVTWCALVYRPLREALHLPEKNAVYGTMMVGYPKVKYYRIPKRSSPIEWR